MSFNLLSYTCIDKGLKLLHPMMPFITEELYQRLPHPNFNNFESICIASFPSDDGFFSQDVNDKADFLFEVVHKINAALTQFNIKGKKPNICICSKKDLTNFFFDQRVIILHLVNGGELSVFFDKKDKNYDEIQKKWLRVIVNANTDVYMDIVQLIDIQKEVKILNLINL